MTLSAAYRIGQTPALLSDTLVSGPVGDDGHADIPTRVDLDGPLPPEWTVAVKGLRRKTVLIAPNLAVAVAGSALGASHIATQLVQKFGSTQPNGRALQDYLALMDDALSDATSCDFVGWIVDDGGPHSFHWNSQRPSDIAWGEDFIIGSGSGLLKEMAWSGGQKDWALLDSFDHAQHYGLTQISALLMNEISNGLTIQSLFGGAYDLTLWDGNRFKYASDCSFLFLSIDWLRSSTKSLTDSAPILLTFAQIEDCLVVRAVIPPNQLGIEHSSRERNAVIAPLTAKAVHNLSRKWNWADVPHFLETIFVVISGVGPAGTLEHWSGGVRGEEAKRFRLETSQNGKVQFWLPQDILDNIYYAAEAQFSRLC